jgi:hypothetical protein
MDGAHRPAAKTCLHHERPDRGRILVLHVRSSSAGTERTRYRRRGSAGNLGLADQRRWTASSATSTSSRSVASVSASWAGSNRSCAISDWIARSTALAAAPQLDT